MVIALQGKNEYGKDCMYNFFMENSTIYSITGTDTGKRDRENNKYIYMLEFKIKTTSFVHFDTVKLELKIDKPEYLRTVISICNQQIANCLLGEEKKSLLIDIGSMEKDKTVLETLTGIMANMEQAAAAEAQSKLYDQINDEVSKEEDNTTSTTES